MSRQPPVQQAPPVQRIRLRYTKRGRMRFTSHRDFSRAFERALMRSAVPMAYSSGFNPHPRISFAGAAPTGAASEAEYLEIALAQVVNPDDVRADLDAALPPGLDVVEAVVSEPGAPSLGDLLQASRWRIVLGWERDVAQTAVAGLLASSEALVERMTKKGVREFDVRASLVSLAVASGAPGEDSPVTLDVVLRHGVPSVRPDDVVSALVAAGGGPGAGGALFTRLTQGPLAPAADEPSDPLAAAKQAPPL